MAAGGSRQRPGAGTRQTYVYFIKPVEARGPIKIGVATDPIMRLRDMQVGSPVKLEFVALMHGDFKQENTLHSRFACSRSHGEWFLPTPDLLSVIADLRATGGKPEAFDLVRPDKRVVHAAYARNLINDFEAGMAVSAIAKKYKISDRSVWSLLERARVSRRRHLNVARNDRIVEMYCAGESTSAIASKFERTAGHIRHILVERGVWKGRAAKVHDLCTDHLSEVPAQASTRLPHVEAVNPSGEPQ